MTDITARCIASVAICVAGAFSMDVTGGETGIGWAVVGLLIIWA